VPALPVQLTLFVAYWQIPQDPVVSTGAGHIWAKAALGVSGLSHSVQLLWRS
jgi:hypothetical protein